MKNNFKIATAIAVAIVMLCIQAQAQFFGNPNGNNWSINTTGGYNVDRVQLSTSTTGFPYAFFIDGSALSSSNTGDVFGTDCPNGNNSYWRMLRNASEKGDIWNSSSNNHFNIQAYRTDGNLAFYTCPTTAGTGVERMTIIPSGFVGIGTPSPQNLLQLYGGGVQITNSSTGSSSSTDGFQFYLSSSDGVIDNKETSKDIWFNRTTNGLGNTTKVIIKATGEVGIGVAAPARKLEVKDGNGGGPQLRLSYTAGSFYTDFLTNSSGQLNIQPSAHRVGIDVTSPSATLDISPSNGDNPLRLRSLSPTGDEKFLVVDGNGVVFYRTITNVVNASGCTATTNMIPVFTSGSGFTICNSQLWDNGTRIGINTTAPSSTFKMDIEPGSTLNGLLINPVNENTGLEIDNTGTNSSGSFYPTGIIVSNTVANSSSSANYGVKALVNGCGTENNAVQGETSATGSSSVNHGVFGSAAGSGANTNIGVYGNASGATTNWAVYANGNAGGTTVWNPSDAVLKTGIDDINNASEIISQLHPRTYYFDTVGYSFMNLPSSPQYGFVAEEVQPTCPNLVKQFTYPAVKDNEGNVIHDAFNIDYMNYTGFIPLIMQVVKEQDQKINDLQAQLDGCCGAGLRTGSHHPNSQSVELVTKDQAQLGDAAPNPNGGETIIPFHLPNSVVKAEMVFTDLLGQEVNRVEIGARGFSQINVTTTQLEDGTYHYTLYADGKVVDSKQMVKVAH